MKTKDASMISLGLGVALGATAGYVVSLLLSDPDKKKQKKQLLAKIDEAKKLLERDDWQERIKDIFDSTGKNARQKYEELTDELAVRLSLVRGSLSSIDEKKYKQVVTEFVTTIQEDGELSDEQIKKLKRYLTRDYKLIKQSLK